MNSKPQPQKPKTRNAPIKTYGNKRRRIVVDLTSDEMAWDPSTSTNNTLSPPTKPRPASQKAATMAVEPDAASVDALVSVCGLDAATAARWLRAKQNDVNAAMNAVFDGESIEKLESGSTWDESVYQTDRDGNSLHPLGTSVPNTGRNSPAPSLGVTNPKTKADEDRELQAALAASREGSNLPFQQESGIIQQDGTAVTFGPATREQYDADQWALVPTYSAAQEIVPDVPARERRQQGPEPRLLKHLPDGDYTPNLITICHAIPKAREAFLMREYVKRDYGHDSEWWKGHSIPMPRIVHTADGSTAEPDSDKYDELITEAQRLMAFLDRSERVYATIGGITSADVIQNNNLQTTKSGTLLELFLQSWVIAAISKVSSDQTAADQVASLFNTTVGTNGKEGMATPDLTVVDLTVKAEKDEKKDLIELLDNLLWDTDPDDPELADNYIEHPADIMVVKVTKSDSSELGLEVPATLHLDKYLQQNVAATKSVRQEMTLGRKRIKKIEQIEKKLENWPHPVKSTQIDARKLLDHTLGHYSGKNHKDADEADQSNSASLTNHELEHYPDVARQLEEIITSIDKKLRILAEEKERTRKAVSDMSKADPPGLPGSEQKHRYTLRGVATKPNITYVLQPKSAEDSQDIIFPDADDTTPKGFQWWRLEYETSASNAKLLRTRIGDYDVLRAVELEHNSALLIYASDEAADSEAYSIEDIPEPLQAFITRDNDHFALELSSEHPDPPPYGDTFYDSADQIPRCSIERRDSMDSTNAVRDDRNSPTLGDSPEVFSDPAQHHAYGLGYGSKFDPEPVDIHLDPEINPLGDSGEVEKETEMVERQHAPLIPRPVTDAAAPRDTAMGDAESQDMGIGGAIHVEDSGFTK